MCLTRPAILNKNKKCRTRFRARHDRLYAWALYRNGVPAYERGTTFFALGPFWLVMISNSTFSPSLRSLTPSATIAEKWTKTSLEPSSGLMNPYPLDRLNHLTTPVVIKALSENVYFYSARTRSWNVRYNIICRSNSSQCKNEITGDFLRYIFDFTANPKYLKKEPKCLNFIPRGHPRCLIS